MNTNTVKLSLVTLLAHLMCMTVVLSHAHAKDAVSLMGHYGSATKLAHSDITAKALGDLRHRLNPLETDGTDDDLKLRFHDFLLRLRVVVSLCFQSV